jgi:GAF domain-containing protein
VIVTRSGHRVPVNVRVSRIELEEGDTALWWRLLRAPLQPATAEPPSDSAAFELAAWMAHAAQELSGEPTPTELLNRAAHLAQASLPAANAVGIAYQRPGHRFEIMAVTGPLARLADDIQYRLDEGPCVDAARLQHAVVTGDVTADPRWPRLAGVIDKTGIRSVLACYLTTPQGRVGALNLYSVRGHAFDAGSQIVAEALAVHAGLALGATEQETTLRQAMGTREMIGQAVGILVERYKVTPTQAFSLLVRASQHRNIKLRDVAATLIETGEDPQPGP